jgi:hypothetical protein
MFLKKLFVLLFFIVLLNLLMAGCGNDSNLSPITGSVTLSGSVLDSSTQKPVFGAVLTTNSGKSVTSDSEGKFSFTFSSNSNYIISISKEGYSGSHAGGFISTANITHNVSMASVSSDTIPVIQDIQ